jgi:hypothetical protein
MTTPLYFLADDTANPIFDGRARAGLRSLKEFEAGTRFVVRRHFITDKPVSIGILWDTTVHTLTLLHDEDGQADKVLAAFTRDDNAIETDPSNLDTIMMTIDPYWDGMGSCPSISDRVLDRLICTQEITIENATELLMAADAESRR